MRASLALLALFLSAVVARGQDVPLFTEVFPPEEFQARREKLFDAIGKDALALVQGAPSPGGDRVPALYTPFRPAEGVATSRH